MSIEEESHLIKDRIDKLKKLRELGIEPYPYSFVKSHDSKSITAKYANLKPEEKAADKVSVAGRIVQLRRMGKATFMHLQDAAGKLQAYFRADDVGMDKYELVKLFDLGDIIGVSGIVFKTKTGEITVYADKFELLSKSLRPLPEKYHGLQDKELRYRKRYLDLIMNPDVKETFVKRSLMVKHIRDYFNNLGFMEVDTPALQIIYGGANAKPFVTHINAWDMQMYLSISPEMYLKRLIVGGFEKVFTICKNFRNEGVDQFHNPEFSMLEFYQAYIDYEEVMRIYEGMMEYVCIKLHGTTKIPRLHNGEKVILDFKAPWQRLTMTDALKKYADIDVTTADLEELKDLMRNNSIEFEGDITKGTAIQLLFEELCEDKLIQPVHITDHPRETTPLCKQKRGNPELIERFESYCLGGELCNAYSELNDPMIQRQLLEEQAKELRGGAEEAHPMDEDFVQAIEYGMPPTGGLGFGVDRMAIVLLGAESIRDVILFPTMKPAEEEKTVEQQDAELKDEFKKVLK